MPIPMPIQVEDDIPLPPNPREHGSKGISKYPLARMAIGQSFLISDCSALAIRQAITRYRKLFPEHNFTIRTQPDKSIRVWRIR